MITPEIEEKIWKAIDAAIEKEISRQTQYISDAGIEFLEEKAPEQMMERIKADTTLSEVDLEEFSAFDASMYLYDVMCEYEKRNPPIRFL